MERFVDRVALVTGASSGIGAVLAEDLVRAGVIVVAVARREQRLTELAGKLAGAKGRLHPVTADLAVDGEVHRVYQWIDANLGGVSIVINNAATLTLKPLQDVDSATIQQIVNTNLTSVMLSCNEALANMKKHNITDGHIVNINSVSGHRLIQTPSASVSLYSTTKHALTALTKLLRFDVQKMHGFRTRVSSISPGSVLTEMTGSRLGDAATAPARHNVLVAKDVSNAVLYALSCPANIEVTELTIQAVGEQI